jgi:hypothetical protein
MRNTEMNKKLDTILEALQSMDTRLTALESAKTKVATSKNAPKSTKTKATSTKKSTTKKSSAKKSAPKSSAKKTAPVTKAQTKVQTKKSAKGVDIADFEPCKFKDSDNYVWGGSKGYKAMRSAYCYASQTNGKAKDLAGARKLGITIDFDKAWNKSKAEFEKKYVYVKKEDRE